MRKTRLVLIAALTVVGYILASLPSASVPIWGIGLFMAGSVIVTAAQGVCVQESIENAVKNTVYDKNGMLTFNGVPVLADTLLLISSSFLTLFSIYFASVQLYL